jgi:hypothetical protein
MPRPRLGEQPMTAAERAARHRARPRFIVMVRDGLHSRAIGPFTTFKAADGCARAWGTATTPLVVLPLEGRDAPEPWNATFHARPLDDRTQQPDTIVEYAKAGGPVPRSHMNVLGDSFWAGYRGRDRAIARGIAGSMQRRAFDAGKARAEVEPGLPLPASLATASP